MQLPFCCLAGFQSHNGAIAAKRRLGANFSKSVSIPQWCDCCCQTNPKYHHQHHRFNPTMVRLLPKLHKRKGEVITSFNPTMVRLLPEILARIAAAVRRKFQSHNGAIAALSHAFCEIPFTRFNPTMVRLLRKVFKQMIERALVSIPQWCDCCVKSSPKLSRQSWFQSHNGAIAARDRVQW